MYSLFATCKSMSCLAKTINLSTFLPAPDLEKRKYLLTLSRRNFRPPHEITAVTCPAWQKNINLSIFLPAPDLNKRKFLFTLSRRNFRPLHEITAVKCPAWQKKHINLFTFLLLLVLPKNGEIVLSIRNSDLSHILRLRLLPLIK